MTNPITPVVSISQITTDRTKLACPSPSGVSSSSPRKNAIWTRRTIIERMYLSAIEDVAGPPLQIGVSESVISGKSERAESASMLDLNCSTN